jgi:hypothetical protein
MAGLVNTARLSARVAGRYANNHVARRGELLSTPARDHRIIKSLY